jgi:signal transduction histidine kinase
MKLSLKTKLVLSYTALALFLVGSLLAVSNHYLRKQFQIYVLHKQDMKNSEITEAVSKNYAGSFASPDAAFLNFLTGYGDSLLEQGIAIMVFDASGSMMYCTTDAKGGCVHLPGSRENQAERCRDIDGAYSQISLDLTRGDKIIGTIRLGYHSPFYQNEGAQSFLSAFNRAFWGMSALFFAAAVAIGLAMACRIARPIMTVTERTRRIAEGEYSPAFPASPTSFDETGTSEIDELSASVDQLARSLETQLMLKKRMASAYSHEFRTPLTVLQSNLEAMIDGLWLPTKERLESLLAEIFRMSRMVSEVDSLVRAGNPETKLEFVPCDLSQLVRGVLTAYEAGIAAKGISLHFDEHFCPDSPVCPVSADPDKLSQVIANLVSNALKYTDPGGNIWVKAYRDGDRAILSVRDDGIGIAQSDMPFIFEHLYRADESRARDSGGNGIGLSVAKAITESHGGTIEAKSNPGQGTIFTVSIPATRHAAIAAKESPLS